MWGCWLVKDVSGVDSFGFIHSLRACAGLMRVEVEVNGNAKWDFCVENFQRVSCEQPTVT
jgi:hypothetical protein